MTRRLTTPIALMFTTLVTTALLVAGAITAPIGYASPLRTEPASRAAKPPGADQWLGKWKTKFGNINFTSLTYAASLTPDISGNTQYYWRLVGTWNRPGGIATEISGSISGANSNTFAGCWVPPITPGSSSCGSVLIHRTGNKITGGYWKVCRNYCESHHPWSGTKISGPSCKARSATSQCASQWGVRFKIVQSGKPLGNQLLTTETIGGGAVTFAKNPASVVEGTPRANTKVIHIAKAITGDLRIDVDITSALFKEKNGLPYLLLRGHVARTNDPATVVGCPVYFRLRDGRGKSYDELIVHLDPDDTEFACGAGGQTAFKSTDKKRLNVTITNPVKK